MRKFSKILVTLWFYVCCITASGNELYVDGQSGSDNADGRVSISTDGHGPFKTINKAIAAAKPGDMIHIMPVAKIYYQGIEIVDKHGEPNKPITIDGHGVTLSGEAALDVNQCSQISPQLWKHTNPLSKTNVGFINRYYFIIDGKMNRMGQCSKGLCAPFLKVEDLNDGQWTYSANEDAYYIKLAPSVSIDSVKVPVICNIVWFRGDSRYITIKNLNTTHSWNDGFNFYDRVSHIRLENVSAVECGDDGFSTHSKSEVELDGYVATRNATGICNTGTGFSSSSHVLLYNNNGYEYSLFGPGRHVLKDSVIYADAVQPFYVHNNNDPNGQCQLDVQNVAVINTKADLKFVMLTARTSMTASNMTLSGIGIKLSGFELKLSNSTISGSPLPNIMINKNAKWKPNSNLYALKNITIDKQIYDQNNFEKYKKSTEDLESEFLPIY